MKKKTTTAKEKLMMKKRNHPCEAVWLDEMKMMTCYNSTTFWNDLRRRKQQNRIKKTSKLMGFFLSKNSLIC